MEIDGTVAPGFERVLEAFRANFVERGEVGASLCVYQHGERIIDLWGGVRDRESGVPWDPDTLVRSSAVNLPYLNQRGILYPTPEYSLQIFTELPEDLDDLVF